jgi:cysteine desulfurase/selenocysteine lyase
MDRSPIDVETLARMANELFREAGPAGAAPGPADIPSAAQAASPAVTTGGEPGHVVPSGPTAGGATFAPSAPPTRPAFGRPVSAEPPVATYGTGQSLFGTNPRPDDGVPLGFDPRALPGFAAIPHVEDGFDVGSLGGLDPIAVSRSFEPFANGSGLAGVSPPTVPPVGFGGVDFGGAPPTGPGLADIPSAVPGTTSGFTPMPFQPSGLPAGGAALSPSAPPTGPAFGRTIPIDVSTLGNASGLPLFGTAPALGVGMSAFGFDPRDGAQLPHGFHDSSLQSFLAPSNVPGLPAAPSGAPYAGFGSGSSVPPGTRARSIDRPTPTAFQFTDAPHLGDFPEESILRSQINPPHDAGVPAIAAPAMPHFGSTAPSSSPSFYFLNDGMDYFANDVPKLARPSATPFNAEAVRADFPIFKQRVNGHPLIWLDNGATTQKPQAVIDRISSFYENENSNINRSAHELAARATDAYEDARKTVQRFINAPTVDELVFVRGTTEGINFVAQSFGRRFIKAGDEIVLTHAEHHANIVPWYLLAKEVGATLRVAPFDDHGEILLDEYEKLLSDRVKIVAMTHVSNALGTVLPAKAMVEMAHRHGIPVLVDAAQSISHMPIDVQDIDCDFFVFSGHKVFAPTGIGAVYGKKALLDQMPPWQGGGNMIKDVTFEKITFQPAPGRFEAGTGNIADAVGLGEAFKYLERLGMTNIAQHEHALLDYATHRLAAIKGLTIIGTAKEKAGVISFLLEGREPVEVGKALNQKGIAVRAGHHCAMPILRRYGVEATIRPAFAMYNTFEDADRLAEAVREIAAS